MSEKILLSAHQPVYLPWLGLFHKLDVADVFVVFDDVPYSRKLFYNRNKILGANGPIQLSVPVIFSMKEMQLQKDVCIDNNQPWQKKHWRSIETSYCKHPYFQDYAGELNEIYEQEWVKIADLNFSILKFFMKHLNITTKLYKASDYRFKNKKSELILEMSQHFNAYAYLFGELGKNYADVDAFLDGGIVPLFQEYKHPTYKQKKISEFVPYMSTLDLLFNCGSEASEIFKQGNLTNQGYKELAARFKKTTKVINSFE